MPELSLVLAGGWVAARVGAEMVKAGGTLLGRVAGPSADELGLHYGEKVKQWRLANLLKTAAKAQQRLTEKGVEAQEVPPHILWPMLERLSLCDDETLSERWAALLANAADPSFPGEIHPSYSAILSELTTADARLLAWANEHHNPFMHGGFHSYPFSVDYLGHSDESWKHEVVEHSCAVLERHGIWRRVVPELDVSKLKDAVVHWSKPQGSQPWYDFSSHHKFKDGREGLVFTRMGAEFTRACSAPSQKPPDDNPA